MKIMVTGGAGYIGSELCSQLLAAGHSVVVYDRFFFKQDIFKNLLHSIYFSVVKNDIRLIKDSDFSGIDVVIDLAALSNDPSGDLNPAWTKEINHLGRVNVATRAKKAGVSRYILASSCSVYGDPVQREVDENSLCNPLTAYAKANLDAEAGVLALSDSKFTVTVLRQATVFGKSERMRFDLVVNLMTLHAFTKKQIYIMGGGNQWRPLVHVADTSRAFTLVMSAAKEKIQGEIFNIGLSNFTVAEIAYIVRSSLPFEVSIELLPEDADKRSYSVSFSKAKSVIGFEAKNQVSYGVNEIYNGLKCGELTDELRTKTVAWYKYLLESRKLLTSIQIDGKILDI